MSLKDAMQAKKLTDAELATIVGVNRVHITKIKNGDRSPSLAVAVRIEAATGVPAASLLKGAA